MSNDSPLDHRIVSEYREMPDLALTVWQAARLWSLEQPRARRVLEDLERTGALRQNGAGQYLLGRAPVI